MQAQLEVNMAEPGSQDDQTGREDRQEKPKEEDVSSKWDASKQQQAVETLLGSCAGNDFELEAEPPEVPTQHNL